MTRHELRAWTCTLPRPAARNTSLPSITSKHSPSLPSNTHQAPKHARGRAKRAGTQQPATFRPSSARQAFHAQHARALLLLLLLLRLLLRLPRRPRRLPSGRRPGATTGLLLLLRALRSFVRGGWRRGTAAAELGAGTSADLWQGHLAKGCVVLLLPLPAEVVVAAEGGAWSREGQALGGCAATRRGKQGKAGAKHAGGEDRGGLVPACVASRRHC